MPYWYFGFWENGLLNIPGNFCGVSCNGEDAYRILNELCRKTEKDFLLLDFRQIREIWNLTVDIPNL